MEMKLLTEDMLQPHGTTLSVLVDGIKAKCVLGSFGTFSDRINITFETDHAEFGKTFKTKHFRFMEPGIVQWGHDFDQFEILVLDEENPFDENASSHPFNDD